MRRKIVLGLLILLCFLLQTTVFHAFSFVGIAPNLLLILTVSFGFMRGKKEGLLIGFFCGLCIDVFYSPYMGIYALLYMILGYANGMLCKVYYDEDIKVPIVLIAVSDLAYGIGSAIVHFFVSGRFALSAHVVHVMFPEMIYTVVLAILVYRLLYIINKRLSAGDMDGKELPWLKR